MARFSRIGKSKHRCAAAEDRWRELVDVLREATGAPNYCGPELQVVERIQADMAAVGAAIVQWRAKAEGKRVRVAPAPSALKLMESRRAKNAMAEVEAILRMAR